MAQKIVCDVCDGVIADGENAGKRTPIFSWQRKHPRLSDIGPKVELQIKVRVDGVSDPDLCVACLKLAVAES